MTATAADLRITVQGVRFVAARQDGRYRVLDQEQDFAVVGTCATRAKAEERAAAMNAAQPVAEATDADIAAMVEREAEYREELGIEAPVTRAADLGPADEKEAAASVLAEAVASGRVSFDAAASALLSGVSLETAAAIAAPQEDPADAIAAAAAEILAVASANAAKPAKGKAAKAEKPAAAAGHRISWFVYLEDGVRTRYSTNMAGDLPAWDLTCSCGWDSRTGGATKGAVRKMMAAHKAEHSA